MAESEAQLRAVYPDPEKYPAPEAVNDFRLSRVGGEVQLLVGYIDLSVVVSALERARSATETKGDLEIELPVHVLHRFQMSARALVELRSKINYIYDAMLESGEIVVEEESDDG